LAAREILANLKTLKGTTTMENKEENVIVEEFVFEQLEDRVVPISGGCVTSSSCSCSSSSCVFMA
jgi:hypothetical protein